MATTTTTQKCAVCSTCLNKSSRWSSTGRITKTEANKTKQPAASNKSIEDEYIKQLQKEIYLLESECRYLREQLTTKSNLINRTLIDEHLHQIDRERTDLRRNLIERTSQFDQLSSENYGLSLALDELRRKFNVEKQTLEQQLAQQILQNKTLNDELFHLKIDLDEFKRNLNEFQMISREKDHLKTIVVDLQNENEKLRQNLHVSEIRFNESLTNRTKLNDEKSILVKEMTRLETLAKDFEREAEQLRMILGQHVDSIHMKDKELAILKKKEQSFRTIVDNLEAKLETETIKCRDFDGQIKDLQRQTNIEIQNSLLAQREKSEIDIRFQRLKDQIDVVQNENEHLQSHINDLKTRLIDEENSNVRLRSEIEQLEIRVREIDRLKHIEDLVQSQRWNDISSMAQTMQTLSRTMAQATTSTTNGTIRKKRVEFE